MAVYNEFIPMYTAREEARRSHDIIESEDWNELWNLNSQQGDHSEEYLYTLKNFFFGSDGLTGWKQEVDNGINALDITSAYALSNQGVTPPETGWQTTLPDPDDGQYIWTRFTLSTPTSVKYIYVTSYKAADGTGAGDMLKEQYDSTSAVRQAGGIPEYVTNVLSIYATQDNLTSARQALVQLINQKELALQTDISNLDSDIYTLGVDLHTNYSTITNTSTQVASVRNAISNAHWYTTVTLESGQTSWTKTVQGIKTGNDQVVHIEPATEADRSTMINCDIHGVNPVTTANQISFASSVAPSTAVTLILQVVDKI